MPTYARFEDLPVWQAAQKLGLEVFSFTKAAPFRAHFTLRDQLERASLSVSNNIAEGFERGTTKELLSFIYIARGSAGEVRSILCLIERLPDFEKFAKAVPALKELAESCSRQLRAWANSLQGSELKGQRHLTQRKSLS